MSQVDVPMIRTSAPGLISAPTAPMCASKAPTATATLVVSPSFSAHSGVRLPTFISLEQVSVNRRLRNPVKTGSSAVKNSSEGKPPHSSSHMALCPEAQRLRYICSGVVTPVSKAGIQSQCSTMEYAASRTFSSARSTCNAFAQNHSDE